MLQTIDRKLLAIVFIFATLSSPLHAESKSPTILYDPNPPAEVYQARVDQTIVAKITFLTEMVMIQRRNADKLIPAKNEMPLFSSDIIYTLNSDSRAEITFNNGHVTRLGGESKLIIESVKNGVDGAQQSLLNLINGQVLIQVQKLDKANPNETFQIKTPVSISAVKGTKFLTTFSNHQTEIKVLEGMVQVANLNGQAVSVSAGLKTALGEGQKPKTPQELTSADRDGMLKLEKETRPKSWLRKFFPDNKANQKSINPRFFHLQGPQ